MPTYTFIDQTTGESEDRRMPISELEQYLSDNPNLKQVLAVPQIVDPVRIGVKRTPDSFNDLLKHVKKNYHKSTIQTRN